MFKNILVRDVHPTIFEISMQFLKYLKSISAVLLLVCVANIGNTAVTITINDVEYNYTNTPRLADVLAPIALKEPWYWPASRLYRINQYQYEIEQKRAEILGMIEQIKLDATVQMHTSLDTLAIHITGWQLAQPIPIPIDYDQARLKPSTNPSFESGNYILNLVTRNQSLHLSGLINKEATIAAPIQCSGTFFNHITKLNFASKDFVYVIQPTGKIKKLGIAYWNRECRSLMPGSQIIVPIHEPLFFSIFRKLNEAVVQLATYRIIK